MGHRRYDRFLLALLAFIAVIAGCARDSSDEPAQRHEVLVSAAASLKDAFTEIGAAAEAADTTLKITFNFGASNLLARQIEQGAPVDVFASAAEEIMDSLDNGGKIVHDSRHTFAHNGLVVVTTADNTDTLTELSEASLTRYDRIAIASPGVPARIYAEEALRNAELWNVLERRFVFGGNVRQVLDYVARGEAPIGFVYSSDATAFGKKIRVLLQVPESLHRPISYPAALVVDGPNPTGAEAFMKILLGPTGQNILGRYGFKTP
jgi:molybdate transport system substrate-binding protein